MKNSSLVDLIRFEPSDIDEEYLNCRLTWDQFLMVMEYPQEDVAQTLVITRQGHLLKVNQGMRAILKEFFARQGLDDDQNWAYYRLFNLQKQSRSAVAGRYRLVPTCSPRNHQVCWIMAHHLVSWHACEQGILLIFDVEGEAGKQLQVLVDASAKKMESNLTAADQVADFQLAMMDYEQYRTGSPHSTLTAYDYAKLSKLDQQYQRFQCVYEQRRFNRLLRAAFGEEMPEGMVHQLWHSSNYFYPY